MRSLTPHLIASLAALALTACGDSSTPAPTDATVADRADVTDASDARPPHIEPAPGTPGGACVDGGTCAADTQCSNGRCQRCGGAGELPCPSGCRVGTMRYGVCFTGATAGELGGLCHLEDCEEGACSVPDGLDFVCFACGLEAGQPCCSITGCRAPLTCSDGVCH